MTKAQALKQARKWWGKTAYVEDRGPKASTEHLERYIVGCIVYVILPMKCVKGEGKSWQKAIDSVTEEEKRRKF